VNQIRALNVTETNLYMLVFAMIYYSMSRPGIIIYECIRSVRVVIIPRIKMCLAVIFVYIVGRMDERIMIQRIVLSL